MTLDGLFTLFTEGIKPEVRRRVLAAIADPKVKIGHANWRDCLLAIATEAAAGKPLGESKFIEELGISYSQAYWVMRRWDNTTDRSRERFRHMIREYLEQQKGASRLALIQEIEAMPEPGPVFEEPSTRPVLV